MLSTLVKCLCCVFPQSNGTVALTPATSRFNLTDMVENEGRRLRAAVGRYQNLLKQITDPSVTATLSERIREAQEQLGALERSERSRRSKTAHDNAKPSIVELPSGPTHWSLKDLLAYWRSKQCGGAAPPRSAIFTAELASLLPNIAVVDFG